MGFDKDSSKSGGGYAGGFFQLFDWTAKSRKKLFSSKSDLPGIFMFSKFRIHDLNLGGISLWLVHVNPIWL